MFKSPKGLAVPSEKKLLTELIRELSQFEELVLEADCSTVEAQSESSDDAETSDLAVRVLSSGARVYCPNRQNPTRNRKHHVRSLLIH